MKETDGFLIQENCCRNSLAFGAHVKVVENCNLDTQKVERNPTGVRLSLTDHFSYIPGSTSRSVVSFLHVQKIAVVVVKMESFNQGKLYLWHEIHVERRREICEPDLGDDPKITRLKII